MTNEILAKAVINFETDLTIWGASTWGPNDPATVVAEYGDHYWNKPLWDTNGPTAWVQSIDGGAYETVPLRWSLPYVTEQIWNRAVNG